MPAARLDDLVARRDRGRRAGDGLDPSAIATRTIEPRPGEKAYEELMTEDESTRAVDIGEMYAVLPSIEVPAERRATATRRRPRRRSAPTAPTRCRRSIRRGRPRSVRETLGRDDVERPSATRG